ncbi:MULTISPECIES: hypothetical protein [Mycobacteroides]|jgi:hypothetical protein|nr:MULTISPECIES: hypothetical protein [Mycobacteroides]MBF9523059.1 hypothetical protein [Mycobacteroides chelonae]
MTDRPETVGELAELVKQVGTYRYVAADGQVWLLGPVIGEIRLCGGGWPT